jgi:hypothetical protein
MVDIRVLINESVGKGDLAVNDRVIAGIRPAVVLSVAGDGIRLRFADGTEETMPQSQAPYLVRQVMAPPVEPLSVIDEAWAVATATSVPAELRADDLARLAAQAAGDDVAKIRGWAVALLTGRPVTR